MLIVKRECNKYHFAWQDLCTYLLFHHKYNEKVKNRELKQKVKSSCFKILRDST